MTPTQLEHLTPAERDLHARGLADLPASTRVVLEPLRTVAELRAENERLQGWKDSAMAIEATWDEQEVSRLLELPLGQGIRSQIAPKIKDLRARVAALEHQIRENDAYIALYGTGHHRTCRVAKPVPGECDCGYKRLRETNAALAARPEVKR